MTSKTIELFESIIGKKPDAFLHEPVYQVTESELLEFAQKLAAPEAPRQEPVAWTCKALKGVNGEHGSYSRIASSKDEMLHFRAHYEGIGAAVTVTPLYSAPLSPDHSGGGAGA